MWCGEAAKPILACHADPGYLPHLPCCSQSHPLGGVGLSSFSPAIPSPLLAVLLWVPQTGGVAWYRRPRDSWLLIPCRAALTFSLPAVPPPVACRSVVGPAALQETGGDAWYRQLRGEAVHRVEALCSAATSSAAAAATAASAATSAAAAVAASTPATAAAKSAATGNVGGVQGTEVAAGKDAAAKVAAAKDVAGALAALLPGLVAGQEGLELSLCGKLCEATLRNGVWEGREGAGLGGGREVRVGWGG